MKTMISRMVDELEAGLTNINGIKIGITDYRVVSHNGNVSFEFSFEILKQDLKTKPENEHKNEFRFKD